MRPGHEYIPPAPIPEQIQLRDGREFPVAELMAQVGKGVVLNLQTGQPRTRGQTVKYSTADREWICANTFEDIARRYGVTLLQARGMRNYNRQVLGWNNTGD